MFEGVSVSEAVIIAVISVTMTGIANVVVQWIRTRGENKAAGADAEATLQRSTEEFSIKLLEVARTELGEMSELRKENKRLRTQSAKAERLIEQSLSHVKAALDHIEAMLTAETEDERNEAKAAAQEFYDRLRANLEKE